MTSFILTPSLDIKNIKIITSSGYEKVDKNTLATIEKSKEQYPKPLENTEIIINTTYKLYE